jgi:hypothetical protein
MRLLSRSVLTSLAAVVAIGSVRANATTPAQNVQAAGTVLLALYHSSPELVRRMFVEKIENEFFPLPPGTTFVYEGTKDGVPTRTRTHVTRRTVRILNIDCTVVHDQDFEEGVLAEDTFDYYAQDRSGNVWYFGEDTKELDEQGHVTSTEGTWRAGVNGAAPGLIMEARPRAGDLYYQELSANVAEDLASVRGLNASACVPYGCFEHVLRTRETNRFELGVVDQKYYARHVGFIRSDVIAGGDEHSLLVRIIPGELQREDDSR